VCGRERACLRTELSLIKVGVGVGAGGCRCEQVRRTRRRVVRGRSSISKCKFACKGANHFELHHGRCVSSGAGRIYDTNYFDRG